MDPAAPAGRAPNRLARETSPYLLQHAHNPVDWQPWGSEAFERARRDDRPIFLSVGYSTCYWCHVMERQSFENEATADLMNRLCVNIKVDREERPDVDQLYMTAVQIMTHQGGWPMSVFLTPDLRPFFGGTYFPPADAYGRPGFPRLLEAIADAFAHRRDQVERTADQLTSMLAQLAHPRGPERDLALDAAFVDRLIERSVSDYEPRHGGFGAAPKFPRQTLLELLLCRLDAPEPDDSAERRQRLRIAEMLRHTLDAMAAGGIRDHLGGGFHRYSTDARWLVPHFEIMLYDNAMLALVYAEASRVLQSPDYAEVARGICDFVLREMTSPEGAFYTAIDAEVDAREGLSYLWTAEEAQAVLGRADGEVFARAYGLDDGPNFADPHHDEGVPQRNILFVADRRFAEEHAARLRDMRERLRQVRAARKQPLTDTKILTSWNALMIRGLARSGRLLGERRYVEAASRAAGFLLERHGRGEGGLCRTSRDGVAKFDGFVEDYAFLALALLELADATGDDAPRRRAGAVLEQVRRRFADGERGGLYFTDAGSDELIVRQKVATDSPLPSGNALAAIAMLRLGDPAGAAAILRAFAGPLEAHGEGMSSLVQAAMLYVRQAGELTVRAEADTGAGDDAPPSEQIVGIRGAWVDDATLRLTLSVRPGFHLQAHDAAEGLTRTELLDPDGAVESIEYPPGRVATLPLADEPMRLYDGEFAITVRFRESARGRPGPRLTLRYQACDESACQAATSLPLEVAPPGA